mmetsp:Transcript_5479/g.11567  ORF Transcript_5479/g.11567 Transcript_5479/m.11567 type:complete len:330 (+) Transcript_5479:676-1665(+)
MALPDDHHRGVGDRLRSGLRGLRGDGRIGIPPFLEHGLRGSPPEGPGGDRGTGVGNDTRRPRRPGPPPRRRDGRRLCQRAGVGRLDGNGPGQQVARGRGPADRSRQRQGPPRLRLSEPLPEAPPGGGRPRALRRRVPRARRLQRHRGRSRHGRERMAADGEVLAARLPRADPGVSERTKPSDRRALVRARIQRCRHETKQNKTEQNRTERVWVRGCAGNRHGVSRLRCHHHDNRAVPLVVVVAAGFLLARTKPKTKADEMVVLTDDAIRDRCTLSRTKSTVSLWQSGKRVPCHSRAAGDGVFLRCSTGLQTKKRTALSRESSRERQQCL